MAITIEQKPNYSAIPVGQDVIFSVSDATVLANYFNVRFYCDVEFSSTTEALQSNIVTLKTTPNAAGSGIFDIRRSLEAELSADYTLDSNNSNVTFKGDSGVEDAPIHHTAKYTTSKYSSGNFTCKFYVKGSAEARGVANIIGSVVSSDSFFVYNGVPDSEDIVSVTNGDYYYDLNEMGMLQNASASQFLTGMTQVSYARLTDVGTVGLLQGFSNFLTGYVGISSIVFDFYNSSGSIISSSTMSCNVGAGGTSTATATTDSTKAFLFAGVYPANIRQHTTIPSGTTYYTFTAKSSASVSKTKTYTVNIIEECEYPVTRLCWLNKFGTWDYYNFTVKSTKSTSADRKFYNSSRGNWSGSKYKNNHYKGGKRVYQVNSRDTITLNTDYLLEEEGVWLESLMSSSEVFLIKEGSAWDLGDAAVSHSNFNDLVEPVVITNSAITRRTKANDTLISHQFTIEKSNNNNTHRI